MAAKLGVSRATVARIRAARPLSKRRLERRKPQNLKRRFSLADKE
ncbi:MAG: hypothetical protein ACRD4Q_00265 [Candidatus Acidiferrales bacterium]